MHEDTLGTGTPSSLFDRVSGTILQAGPIKGKETYLADPTAVIVAALLTLSLTEGAQALFWDVGWVQASQAGF